MRLIDTDALIKSVPDAEPDIFENCQRCKLLDREQVVELIEKQYLIDAVEVVRCEDCRYNDGGKPIEDGRYFCLIHWCYMYYCSDAERKEK